MIAPQTHFWPGRYLVWYSCGVASAVSAAMAVAKYGDQCKVCYCDTSLYEHPDNARFTRDVEQWIGKKVEFLRSAEYPTMDIREVFLRERFIRGPHGANCTRRLKIDVRKAFQWSGDVHIFGYTFEEPDRIEMFENDNPSLSTEWILADNFLTKDDCHRIIREQGIAQPALYLQGYKNNNCIGCVKGGKGYWNKIRRDYPEHFAAMATIERQVGASCINGTFLDELDPLAGRYDEEPNIECGAMCVMPEEQAA